MVADPWSGNRRESNRDNVLDRKPDSLFRGVKVSSAIVKDTDLGLFVTIPSLWRAFQARRQSVTELG